jgi:hypothetical protein
VSCTDRDFDRVASVAIAAASLTGPLTMGVESRRNAADGFPFEE